MQLPNSHQQSTFLVAVILCAQLTSALVTLDTIRNLTALTDDCREKITEVGGVERVGDDGLAVAVEGMPITLQVPLRGNRGNGEEVEETISAALRILCSSLLLELEKPLDPSPSDPLPPDRCERAVGEYHDFIGAMVRFLYEVQEQQMLWSWSAESGVFNGLALLQGLWASRKTNSQERSFIEQQIALYASTRCFGKSKEVLRRDVEVVEYLNDLIDSFN